MAGQFGRQGWDLRAAREGLAISQEALAREMRGARTFLSEVENGREPLTEEYWERAVRAMARIQERRAANIQKLSG